MKKNAETSVGKGTYKPLYRRECPLGRVLKINMYALFHRSYLQKLKLPVLFFQNFILTFLCLSNREVPLRVTCDELKQTKLTVVNH